MKIKLFPRAIFIAMFTIVALSFVACDKNDDSNNNDNMYTVSGSASGSQEVPAVTTSATGSLTGTYNSNTNELNYTISWTGLSGDVVAAHFHGPAAPGESADPIITLTVSTNGVSGTITGTMTLPDSTENYLLNGQLYYNLHTTANPTGEIRGQVMAAQ